MAFRNNTFVNIAPPSGLPAIECGLDSEFEKFGVLYKHCKGIHLPRPDGNIRLGTLSQYRRHENKDIRDEHEGTFRVTLNIPEQTSIEIDALRRATLDTSPLGIGANFNNIRTSPFDGICTTGSVYSTDKVEIEQRTEKEITLSGRVDIHAEGADAYVLCLSTSNDVESVILDPEYNSIWSIRSGSVMDFTNHLAAHLMTLLSKDKHFSPETVGPLNAPGFSPPPQNEHMVSGVSSEIWEVTYRDRIIDVSTAITKEIVQNVHGCIDRSASIKPKSFSHEKEVRIIFRPVLIDRRDGRRYLFPNYLEPAFVPFEPFLSFVDVFFDVAEPTAPPT